MKVLISAEMEGTCGVTSWVQVTPPEYGGEPTSTVEYERARLTRERHQILAIGGMERIPCGERSHTTESAVHTGGPSCPRDRLHRW